jgi:hypothetical protein
VTEAEFRRGPAEDRLARAVEELRAITAEVEATPLLAPAARDPLRLAALELVEETKRLARAVVEAAHRVPGPEDA